VRAGEGVVGVCVGVGVTVGVGVGVGVTVEVAVDSVNGSGPCAAAGCKKTSPLDFVSLAPSPPQPATRSAAESAQAVAMVPVTVRT
jgi:hypothetical protein